MAYQPERRDGKSSMLRTRDPKGADRPDSLEARAHRWSEALLEMFRGMDVLYRWLVRTPCRFGEAASNVGFDHSSMSDSFEYELQEGTSTIVTTNLAFGERAACSATPT